MDNLTACRLCLAALAVLQIVFIGPVCAQEYQIPATGTVDDWTHHHLVFSNPGTEQDAIRNGSHEAWLGTVTDDRYRIQWLKRYGAANRVDVASSSTTAQTSSLSGDGRKIDRPGSWIKRIHGDWAVTLAGGAGFGPAPDMYPAKYTFSPIGNPSCTDFVVFQVNTNGAVNQANLIGVNSLYKTTCSGSVPATLFYYNVGSGSIKTSPVLSTDGTKVAFVETVTNGSVFHVLTIGTTGNNGTSFNSPAVPGSSNNAVNVTITMNGNVTVTRSSPFVDYKNDNAYVGDDSGKLHKFHPVFSGTPAEVTTAPWPFTVASSVILTGPVFDGGSSQNIFVGGSDGNLYCVTSAGAHCATSSVSVASGASPGVVLDAPIVDSTNQTVFATASNSTNSILMQAKTSLASPVRATMGANGTDLYAGAFDNAYFTSVGTGHMYFCGNLAGAATPTLYRVTFNGSGTMSGTNDGNSFQLVLTGNTGSTVDCTPLTEVLNGSTDYLFLGVFNHGFTSGSPNCGNQTCMMSFVITSSFPSAANAITTSGLGSLGMSGIIIDNVSGVAGASQIYFGGLQNNTGVQASQSALQ